MMEKYKALVMFSGGLDSMLAAKILMEQGIDVTGLHFSSYFFDAGIAKKSAKMVGIELIENDLSKEHFDLVKKPKFGYGKALNPCIDCHSLMIRRAWEIKNERGFDILASGEVLGQRPFSQTKHALKLISKVVGESVEILRPLSAKAMEPTCYEKDDLVKRDLLLEIVGRNRKVQMLLADKFGFIEFPTPSGGCLLTEKGFVRKLKKLMSGKSFLEDRDFELIKIGRHLWEKGLWVIVGRNKLENEFLKTKRFQDELLVELLDFPGPIALAVNLEKKDFTSEQIAFIKSQVVRFSKKNGEDVDGLKFNLA